MLDEKEDLKSEEEEDDFDSGESGDIISPVGSSNSFRYLESGDHKK